MMELYKSSIVDVWQGSKYASGGSKLTKTPERTHIESIKWIYISN